MVEKVLFHMNKMFREGHINTHNCYVDEARKRLLSQFNNIDEEAEKYVQTFIQELSKHVDSYEACEMSYDEHTNYSIMFSEMYEATLFSVIAAMFHAFDKTVRSWITKEMYSWLAGKEIQEAIWKANFEQIIDLFEDLDWSIKTKKYYKNLDKCRLVVNVYKHGNGNAFNSIKEQYPELIHNPHECFQEYINYTSIFIEDKHLAEFSDAIIAFWNDVPEYICKDFPFGLPNWLESS